MNKVFSNMIVVACAGVTFAVFAQPAVKSTETTVEQSTTVQQPKADVKVDEKRSTTTTTTKPAEAKSKSKTTTTTSERSADGDTKVEVKSKTKTETEKRD
jgi:hypothetical protein